MKNMKPSHLKLELLPNGQVKIVANYVSGYDLAANLSYLINLLFSALAHHSPDIAIEFGATFSQATGDSRSPVWGLKSVPPTIYAELLMNKTSTASVVIFDETEGSHEPA